MSTTEAHENNHICPDCGGRLSQGYVRHLERKDDGNKCTYGLGDRD